MDRQKAEPTVLIDNAKTRVIEWHFAPGAHTGWHRHEHDYVIIPGGDGRLEIVTGEDESSFAEMRRDAPYFREAGVEHDVINASDGPYSFIEIEFL